MDENENRAILSRSALEITGDSVRLHAGQVHESGILPAAGGDQHRRVQVDSGSCVKGSIFAGDIHIQSATSNTSTGTEIQGSVNALKSVGIGHGAWIQGGVMARGTIRIDDTSHFSTSIPGHIVIEGGVSGDEVYIGDGALILGPVVASSKIVIGKGVTIRDHVMAPEVTVGDGCLLGSLIASSHVAIGRLCTVSSSYLILPNSRENWNFSGPIRSPDMNCDYCPEDDFFGTGPSTVRKLACHYFSEHVLTSNSIEINPGKCNSWGAFPVEDIENQWMLPTGLIVVSQIENDWVNHSIWAGSASRWERGGED
tara:strand:- start:358 stop:1293 length:936 start_codon:yes stop_codon:yes gene_type:complete